jgi:hypothetical protein
LPTYNQKLKRLLLVAASAAKSAAKHPLAQTPEMPSGLGERCPVAGACPVAPGLPDRPISNGCPSGFGESASAIGISFVQPASLSESRYSSPTCNEN